MQRRSYLRLAAGAGAVLAGCTAEALPGPDPSGEPDRVGGCPPALDVDRTVCPGDDGPLSVDQSSDSVSGDAWSLVVAVANRSAESLGVNPYAWSVFQWDGDRWRHVAPDASIEPWLDFGPGDRYVWQLTTAAGGFDDADQRVYLDLDPGPYAFGVPFQASDRLGAVVTFEVID